MTREDAIKRIRYFGLYHAISDNPHLTRTVEAFEMAIKALEQPEIIRCRECKYSYMTYDGKCKYCDIWFPDEKCYMDGDHFCASAERREEGESNEI